MDRSRLEPFGLTLVLALPLAFLLAAALSPPDPVTLYLYAVGFFVGGGVPVAHVLVYSGGYDRLGVGTGTLRRLVGFLAVALVVNFAVLLGLRAATDPGSALGRFGPVVALAVALVAGNLVVSRF